MKGISLKVALWAAFYLLAAAVLSGCVVPVNLQEFVEDEKVAGIIAGGVGRVVITAGSESGLTAGSGRISGLMPGKYYMIEEWIVEEVSLQGQGEVVADFVGVQFVTNSGGRSENPVDVGSVGGVAVGGGTITGLTNGRHYRVTAAKPLTGNVSYHDFIDAPPPPPTGAGKTETVQNGGITIKAPGEGRSYYLDPHPAINNFNINDYDIVKVPVSPSGANSLVVPVSNNPNIFKLEGGGTQTDYIFVLIDGDGNVNTKIVNNFLVLSVIVKEMTELKVSVTFSAQDGGINLLVGTAAISKSVLEDGGRLVLTIDTSAITGTVGAVGFIAGGQAVSGNVLAIEYGGAPDIDGLLVVGSFNITVVVTVDGTVYSKVFTVTIS